ncbi:MAG: M3 family oligoendopeptidase [Candidatus Edwardsbacteria bacterium]|nr:M3 family oligoendopeptidase [Candidatus Edwardsbacteria bacterium]
MPKNVMVWNLYDIVPKGFFDKLYAETEAGLAEFAEQFAACEPDMAPERFTDVIRFNEAFLEKLNRVGGFAELMNAADLRSQEGKLLKSRYEDLKVKYDDAFMPIRHWVKGLDVPEKARLDDANAARLFAAAPELAYVLQYWRLGARHTLSQNEEKIINRKKVTGANALNDLYDQITDSFIYIFKPKGRKPKALETQESALKYVRSAKAAEREAAYQCLLAPYRENLGKLFTCYSALVKDWDNDAKLRNFASPIARRNFYNQVPNAAVETLLTVTGDNAGLYQDYFRLKARLLGMKKLRRYDIYAPLETVRSTTSLPDGIELVFDTFAEFSDGFAERAKTIVAGKHVDSHPRPGKRTGAFCASVTPSVVPYVLLNYTGDKNAVSTLAHELGHGIHDLYAAKQSISAFETPLPLAETASTLAEMIVFEKLLAQCKSDRERRAMLLVKIGESYATVMRQSYFVRFELEAHRRIESGVKEDDLCRLYEGMLKEQFGSAVEVDPIFRHEWAYIPHIFKTPFYCYAYNFGELLSLALYARYKQEGKRFVPAIERILAYGSSQAPDLILKEAGIDMSSREFWQGSFDVIGGWLKDLKRLGARNGRQRPPRSF